MGCSQSTMEYKEAVNQCKQRKAYIKQSISAHHAFAAAHFAYAAALNNTGAALCNYAHGELQRPAAPHSESPGFKPHSNTIEGKINEIADRSSDKSSVSGNLNREMGKDSGIVPWDFFFTSMEGVQLAEVDDESRRIGKSEIQMTMADDKSGHGAGGGGGCRHRSVVESEKERALSSVKEEVQSMKLLQVIKELDDGFVKASKIANEIAQIIDADMLYYDSSSVDRSLRVTTTLKHLFKGHQIANDDKENHAPKEEHTHSMILDNILAWEKKLYDEVKAGEEMKYVYKKKSASLNKLTKRGASSDSLMRTKEMVSHLHTRCIVQLQSIDSTVFEINRLRDEQLYPTLVQLVQEMGAMWKRIRKQHEKQLKVAQELFAIKISQLPNETSENNLRNTNQLHVHVKIWCSEFQKLILHQKEYIKSLHSWLKLNLMSIDNNLRDNISSPQKPQNPKIGSLLRTWQDQLEKLPEEGAKNAINTFAAEIDTIIKYISDEMQTKKRCEETRREICRKSQKFEEWCDKHIGKRTPTGEMDLDVVDDIEVIAEHQIVVEALKRRLEEEEEAYRRQCVQVKDKSLMNLKTGLPEILASISEFSRACSHMYKSLKF